jgi:hypothetical protein
MKLAYIYYLYNYSIPGNACFLRCVDHRRKILLFNCMTNRPIEALLKPLALGDGDGTAPSFDQVFFCPSIASLSSRSSCPGKEFSSIALIVY